MYFLATIAILLLIVTLHEFGHYLAARAVGIVPSEFSIGMGPLIRSFQTKNTKWSLRMIPIGGYVKLPDDLREKPLRHQTFIAFCGPLMNYVCAALAVICIFFFRPVDSQAARAQPLHTVIVGLERPFVAGTMIVRSLPEALSSHDDNKRAVGPIGIVKTGDDIIKNDRQLPGLSIWLRFVALFAILNIAVMATNLLPLPILDGGRIMFCLINGIGSKFGRSKWRIPLDIEARLTSLAVVALVFFLVRVTLMDIF